MRSRLTLALAGLACVGALLGGALPQLGAAQVEGTVGIRLLDAPTSRAEDPRARLYVIDHLAPGTTIERRVEVSNDTNEPQDVTLYAAAAEVEDGEFNFGEGRAANDLTRWTTVTPSSLSLRPGEKGSATVKVAVPADAPPGEQYGVIWAEVRAPATDQRSLGAVNRVGIRMYVSIGPGGEPATDFEIRDITGHRGPDGRPVVEARIDNTGGRAIDLSGVLNLTNGPGGLSAGPFDANPGTTVGVGQTADLRAILNRAVPDGPWDAHIILISGTTEREATGRIHFGGGSTDAGPRWALFVALGLLMLLLLWLLILAWRRRKKKEEDEDEDVLAPTGSA